MRRFDLRCCSYPSFTLGYISGRLALFRDAKEAPSTYIRRSILKTQFAVGFSMLVGVGSWRSSHRRTPCAVNPKRPTSVTEVDNHQPRSIKLRTIPKVGEVIKIHRRNISGTRRKDRWRSMGEAPKRVTIVVYDSLERRKHRANSESLEGAQCRGEARRSRPDSFVTEGLPN